MNADRHRNRKERPAPESPAGEAERLQKVLASAGFGSRRECEELILQGRVEVDGQVADKLGTRVDPAVQQLRVDGTPVRISRRVYFAVNKPPGVVTTNRDPSGRPRVVDLVRTEERVFAVGRLDRSSEGLILVTNDGELANELTHPRYGVTKVYRVRVAGQPSVEVLQRLRRGIHLAEGVAKVAAITVRKRYQQSTELEVTLDEGRNREIRRILARVGHKVLGLKRIAFGPIKLANLPSGASRRLTGEEVRQLERATRRSTRGRPPSQDEQRGPAKRGGKKRPAAGSGPRSPRRKPDAAQRFGSVLSGDFDEAPRPDKPPRPAKRPKSRGKRAN